MSSAEQQPTASSSLATWEANAEFWDDGVGATGNIYWKRLQEPSLRRLLADRLRLPSTGQASDDPKKTAAAALDLCTGNGLVARWLRSLGAATVVATDGSAAMLERARARTPRGEETGEIEFRVLDVTSGDDLGREADLAAEKFGGYDVVTMNMAIMDVITLEPLAEALPNLLKKDGVFVATLLHPVFFTSSYSRTIDLAWDPETGDLNLIRAKTIREYLSIPPTRGIAIPGQPAKQWYFHRPVHEVLAPFFAAGLVMDRMEEPAFEEQDAEPGRVESSRNFTQLPAILSFRLRRGDALALKD